MGRSGPLTSLRNAEAGRTTNRVRKRLRNAKSTQLGGVLSGIGVGLLCNLMDCSLSSSFVHGILQARILTGVGSHFLLQGIVLIQGWNPLLHWQVIHHWHHRGSLINYHEVT